MDNQAFDRFARVFGARQTRRQSLATLAGAAAAVVGLGQISDASAGVQQCAITCPISNYWPTDADSCTGSGTLDSPTVNDLCGDAAIVCNIGPGSATLPLGSNTITCSVAETSATCSYDIFVYDNNLVTATCPADISETVEGPTAVEFPDATAGTICGSSGYVMSCDHASGDIYPLGTTLVTCTAIQPSGKGPDPITCSFNITLAPAPTATETPTETPTDIPATLDPSTEVPATEIPSTAVPATQAPAPTATAPVTSLPNTGAGTDGGSAGMSKLLPLAVVGAGAAALVRLGLRKPAETPEA